MAINPANKRGKAHTRLWPASLVLAPVLGRGLYHNVLYDAPRGDLKKESDF
jgi:hypothetical protein